MQDMPEEFDAAFYGRYYSDLGKFSETQLRTHWLSFGRNEARIGSAAAIREGLLEIASKSKSVLEIGPFCNPCVRGPNVKYFDVLDQEALTKRSLEIGYSTDPAPHIDYVSPVGDLSVVTEQFDAVVSSHCIEHQPDLVHHLQQVGRILSPDGRYFIISPDKRYCFDHYIDVSSVADVIEAHHQQRKVHTLASVIEHRALTTHNDTARHWNGDHANSDYQSSIPRRTAAAIEEHKAANGEYIDVHAWQFTPDSFRNVVAALSAIGLIGLKPERVYATCRGRNEFTAILSKQE